MSNNFWEQYSNNNYYLKVKSINTNFFKKIRNKKSNPYRPKKSNSLNKNSFFSLINITSKENNIKNKSESRKEFNFVNLSKSTKYKERNTNPLISNSLNKINDFPKNKNMHNIFTKYQWHANTKKEEYSQISNMFNYKNKLKDRSKFYFPKVSKKHSLELDKNCFNINFSQDEKNNGTNNNNFQISKLFFKQKLVKPLENENMLIRENQNNTNSFKFRFKSDKKLNDISNILPIIEKGQSRDNFSKYEIKIKENDSVDSELLYEEIKSDITLTEYFYNNCELIKNYAYKEDSNMSHRFYMEDKSRSIINLNQDGNNSIFCLFDGHGGNEVSIYLQNNFHYFMKEHLPFDSENYELFFKKLFNDIDLKLQTLNYYSVGSTASIIYIKYHNLKKYLYSVNIGDSRMILIKSKEFKRISYDDRVSDADEYNRIIKNGGLIINNRIYGQLMLSRSFGDWELKRHGVISEPHVMKLEIGINDLFVVMASDGVWDVLDEIEVYDMSFKVKNSKEFCNNIVKYAIEKGSTDNISCFVLQLNHINNYNS